MDWSPIRCPKDEYHVAYVNETLKVSVDGPTLQSVIRQISCPTCRYHYIIERDVDHEAAAIS